MNEYQALKETLLYRITKLEAFTSKVETYKQLLSDKTKGYITEITRQSSPFADTWFYIVRWFRTFVGIKDEAMLLINGELVRKYHKQMHEEYIHSRGSEDKYYKTGLLGLSGCCVDGLNFDLRYILKKYSVFASKRKEEEILNSMSDQVYNIEIRLDGFCKAIDKFVDVFRTELKKKAGSHILQVSIEYKYKAEHLDVKFNHAMTTCQDAFYTCKEARKGSRSLALHSGIEDPPSRLVQQQVQQTLESQSEIGLNSSVAAVNVNLTGDNLTSSRDIISSRSDIAEVTSITTTTKTSFRSRMVVADEEDESYRREVSRRKQLEKAIEKEKEQAKLEALKNPDFGFDYSIDAEKREFGALGLLAIPSIADNEIDDDDDMQIIDSHYEGCDGNSGAQTKINNPENSTNHPTFMPQALSASDAVTMKPVIFKIKVCFPEYSVPSVGAHMVRTRLEHTNIFIFRLSSSQQISHIHLSIHLLVAKNVISINSSYPDIVVSVRDLLEEVWLQFWESGIMGMGVLPIPRKFRYNNKEFYAGENIPMPSIEDLTKKRFHIVVEDRAPALAFLQRVHAWISCATITPGHLIEDLPSRRDFLVENMAFLSRVCDYIWDESNSTNREKSMLNLSSLCTCEDGDFLSQLLELLHGGSVGLNISMRGADRTVVSFLPHVLPLCRRLDARACGINCEDLVNCWIAAHGRSEHSIHTARSKLPHLISIDMSLNTFLSYIDYPWELLCIPPMEEFSKFEEEEESEPMDLELIDMATTVPKPTDANIKCFSTFLSWLFSSTPALETANFSHCATTPNQVTHLLRAIENALKTRNNSALPRLRKVILHGLEREYNALTIELIDSIHLSTGGFIGAEEFDISDDFFFCI